ncbi:MAG: hypothetical protein ACI4R8_00290 [Candidatus Caccovivens sp.]
MTFIDWIYSSYPNPHINGQWGWLHIITLILCIGTIIALALIFRKRSEKARKIVIWVLVGLIFAFELSRRVINFCNMTGPLTWNSFLVTLLPRPWCAIACCTLMFSAIVNKRFFYNFASMSSLLCAIIFFAYPGVGFNNQYILFENLYSIVTHSLLLITSITLITLKFTKFEYKTIWKEAILYGIVLIYAIFEIYVLKIESDPLYFMPNGDIQDIFGISYGLYLPIYIIFILVYYNIFYLIDDRKKVFVKRKKNNKEISA